MSGKSLKNFVYLKRKKIKKEEKMKTFRRILFSSALALSSIANMVSAADLIIGIGSEATTMDPHFYNLGPNTEITESVFDRLVHHDADINAVPGLAESWSVAEDGLTWTFNLRKGVTFHDGSSFSAKDVIFSLDRLPKVVNSPSSFEKFLRLIEDVTVLDDYTLRITAKSRSPLLLNDLEQIAIVPASLGLKQADSYNDGSAMIGTGPYKYVDWKRGDSVELAANADYWGEKPIWDKVTFKALTNNTSRTSALLAGDVDVISFVPTVDIKRLQADERVTVQQRAGNRLLYYHLDQQSRPSPMVRGLDGKALAENPLANALVRKALSKAINRDVIVERIMDGAGIKASQLMADSFLGTNPDLKPEPYDPEGAKALLAEAGYPNGFGLTVHGPNNRYPNDAKIVQATAQMLTRVGIDAKVETFPKNVYFGKASGLEFSMMLVGSSANSVLELQTYVLNSYNKAEGLGAVNRGRYTDAEHDQLLAEARVSLEDEKRAALLRKASAISIGRDQAILPVLYFVNSWASRKGFVMHPQAGDQTRPMDITPDS
jgi:peptide/nickel transport system substrate-binding protein